MIKFIRSFCLFSLIFCLLWSVSCQKKSSKNDPSESEPPAQSTGSDESASLPDTATEADAKSSPEPSLPPVKTELRLSHEKMTLSQGSSALLSATLLPEGSTQPKMTFSVKNAGVAYIDQTGKITALKEGKTTLTVQTETGLSAECPLTVTKRAADPIDALNLYEGEMLWGTWCYADGIRINGGNLVFSPYVQFAGINEQTVDRYAAYLRFTYVPKDDPFGEGYTFPSVKMTAQYNKGGWLDFILQGKGVDCGFCPRSESDYRVELVLTNAKTDKVVCYGTYYLYSTTKALEKSKYYKPTPQPGILQREEGQVLLTYLAAEGGMLEGTDLQLLSAGKTGTPVKAVAQKGYRFLMWSDGKKEAERTDQAGKKDATLTAVFIKDADPSSSVANLYIFTQSGEAILSKDYQPATMVISGAPNGKDDLTASLQIKGRGNSSWNGSASESDYDSKNSYRIKLDEKEQLLGVGDSKNKDWVLNANKFDLSGLRNYLVWELATRMGTLPYVPECTWVQLYVNGSYRGLYTLSEHVEAANDRVEVDDSLESSDKGYLLEIDFRGSGENDPFFYVEGYAPTADNQREFVIKSKCSQSDVAFISSYVQKCHDAIISGNQKEIEKLIDLPSLIDMYIIEELSKDVDVGAASFYMQKSPGGKLYFTAPWDFDFGFGTYSSAVSAKGIVSKNDEGCPWFAALIKQTWFRKAVLNRMNELDQGMQETLRALDAQATVLKPAADKNAEFWNMYGTKYHQYVSDRASEDLKNYDEHVAFLKSWTTERWQNMKDFIGSYGSGE